jgi:signal transduction histidine kinase
MHELQDDTVVQVPQINGIDLMGNPQYFVNRKWMQSKLKNIDTIWTVKMDSFYLVQNLPPDSGYLQEKNITWDSLSMRGLPLGLKLPFDQNHITFRFTGTQLSNLNKTRYRFILEGLDKEWSTITDKSFVDYRNLSSGNYTFKVSSSGFNGIWSQPATMQFTILPPWWRSGWAYAFYGLCLLGLVFLADRIQRSRLISIEREKTREREFQQAKEMEKAYHELKTTQTQLIQSEKMASLGELTAGIAHEIQNPLNFVTNFSEVNKELLVEMKDELEKGNFNFAKTIANDVIDNQEKINHHGKRADAIVKGMLQHSKNGIGVKEPTDINALADEYLRLAYHGLKARDKAFNAKMETEFDRNIIVVDIVSQDIGRVLLNLINNAFYAVTEKRLQSPEGFEPKVSVTTKKLDNKIEVTVKDNGKGIPPKILDKIFQPFFTTKPTGQGTGLGLSLSYDIVKAHGGELKVEYKEGEGSEFTILLPSRI